MQTPPFQVLPGEIHDTQMKPKATTARSSQSQPSLGRQFEDRSPDATALRSYGVAEAVPERDEGEDDGTEAEEPKEPREPQRSGEPRGRRGVRPRWSRHHGDDQATEDTYPEPSQRRVGREARQVGRACQPRRRTYRSSARVAFRVGKR
jgi:hypothetical protein